MDFEGPQGVMLKYSPKENKFSLSPHGKILREFLKYILKNPERGIPYTPVGILLDYYHGFSPPYQSGPAFGRSGLQTWFWTPYRKEDHMRYQIFYAIAQPTIGQRQQSELVVGAPSRFGSSVERYLMPELA